jgi:hypothetical protein
VTLRLLALGALLSLPGCCLPVSVSPPAPSADAPTPPPSPGPGPTGSGAPGPPPAQQAPGTTPASGRPGAASAFGLRPDRGLERRAASNLVPQLADARALFVGLVDGPAADAIEGGLLLCDLQLPDTPWFRSRPDVRARFQVGDAPVALADAHDNRDTSTLSVPVDRLVAGQRLRIEVFDRDLFNKDDFLDAAEAPFPGHFPMIFAGREGKLQATCRHLGAAGVARRLGPALTWADAEVAALESALGSGADPAASDLGYPWAAHTAAEDAIDEVAALVGWSTASVVVLRGRRSAGLETWRVGARGVVQDLLRTARPGGDTVDLGSGARVGPVALLCGEAVTAALAGTRAGGQGAPRCVLEVAMVGVALPPLLPGGRTLDLVYEDGGTEPLRHLATRDDKVYFDTERMPEILGRSGFDGAVLVRITDSRSAEVLRLR